MTVADVATEAMMEMFGIGESPAAQRVRQERRAAEIATFRWNVRLIRTIARVEALRAQRPELGHDRLEHLIRDTWASFEPLQPVVELDDTEQERRAEPIDQLRQLLDVYLPVVTPDGAEPGGSSEDGEGGLHRRGDLVGEDVEHLADLVGCGHETSPSLVTGTESVGDRPGPTEEIGPGHTSGGAR